MGANFSRTYEMHRVADTGSQHLSWKVVAVEYLDRLADDFHAIGAGVIAFLARLLQTQKSIDVHGLAGSEGEWQLRVLTQREMQLVVERGTH